MSTLKISFVAITALLLNICVSAIQAQEIVTYIKENGGYTTDLDSADYVNVLLATANDNGLYAREDYYPDGILKRSGFVKTLDPRNPDFEGTVESYHDNGALESVIHYVDNRPTDTASYYYRNGTLKEQRLFLPDEKKRRGKEQTDKPTMRMLYYADSLGNVQVENGNGDAEIIVDDIDVERGRYADGLREGRWEGSFRDAEYRFEEWYTDGIITKGVTTDSLGRQYTYSQQKTDPEYPGGMQSLMRFVANNYQYPKEAILARVSGTVLISFVVDTTGTPVDFDIVNDLGYGSGTAGVNILKRMKQWTPGYERGVPDRVKYTVPIRMNISQ